MESWCSSGPTWQKPALPRYFATLGAVRRSTVFDTDRNTAAVRISYQVEVDGDPVVVSGGVLGRALALTRT